MSEDTVPVLLMCCTFYVTIKIKIDAPNSLLSTFFPLLSALSSHKKGTCAEAGI